MSSRSITPPSLPPPPDEFRPEKFQKKSQARDYVIYVVLLVIVLGMTGGSVYFFTRSESEQGKLLGKLDNSLNKMGLGVEKTPEPLPKLKDPKLDGIFDEEAPGGAAKSAAVAGKKPEASKPVAVSTYASGGPSRVSLSTDPKLPKASVAFIKFAEALKASSVVQGNPAKVMIAGKLIRAGEMIDDKLGVTFVGVDGAKSALILRDYLGAELFVGY
jgi:hypothetical protein